MRNFKTTGLLSGFCIMIASLFIVTGCSSSKKIDTQFLYFQREMDSIENVQAKETIIKNNDILNIQIFSKSINQDQAAIFNLPNNSGYLVGSDGTIDLPLVEHVKAAGLTRVELETSLQSKLSAYVKSPSVLVKFLQFRVNVLGEVKTPGNVSFDKDRVTILDAIGAAGDLTDYGKRQDIIVIREENSVRKSFQVDLQSGKIFQSPVYLLQPNDIVYVGANNRKLKSLLVNPEKGRGFQLFATIFSVALNFAFLVYTISKNN